MKNKGILRQSIFQTVHLLPLAEANGEKRNSFTFSLPPEQGCINRVNIIPWNLACSKRNIKIE